MNNLVLKGLLIAILLNMTAVLYAEDKFHPVFTYLVAADTELRILSFDSENMLLSSKRIAAINNSSFVIANQANNLVFAVANESGEKVSNKDGRVKSFSFNNLRQNLQQSLKLIGSHDTFGEHPCYLSMDSSERFLIAVNYVSGNFSVYKVFKDQLIHIQTLKQMGRSINKHRQNNAYLHSAVFHPNGKQLLVADLGSDKIHIYDFNPDAIRPITLANPAYFKVKSGAGPRHLAIHPDGDQIYLIHELTAELGVYHYDDGNITQSQILPLTDQGFMGNIQAAEVRISADAKFVYASNRGDANDISVFKIQNQDKQLALVQRIASGGLTPRNFILSLDGRFLLAANQTSNNIQVFEIDKKTGHLKPTAATLKINKPAYLFPLN